VPVPVDSIRLTVLIGAGHGRPYLKRVNSDSFLVSLIMTFCFLINNSVLSLLLSTFALERESAAYQNPRNYIKAPWGDGAKNPGSAREAELQYLRYPAE
jgi:hypothetical protein